MMPAAVGNLLKTAFSEIVFQDITPTSGGFSNLTLAATIDGQRCIVKAASTPLKRDDMRREARVLTLLRDHDLPLPTLLTLVEDDTWTVAMTRAVEGDHGLHVLAQAPDELERLYHALGQVLAVVHATPLLSDHPTLLLAERARHLLGMLPTFDLVPNLRRLLQASLEHAAWLAPPTALAHGDVGLHNLLMGCWTWPGCTGRCAGASSIPDSGRHSVPAMATVQHLLAVLSPRRCRRWCWVRSPASYSAWRGSLNSGTSGCAGSSGPTRSCSPLGDSR
jgi:hypothetical protein